MYSAAQVQLTSITPVQVSLEGTPVVSLTATIAAGFPSPAEDHAVKRVDLNEVLIKHPLSTYLMRVRGASMCEAGIDDGDVVLVDKVIKPGHGQVVVAVVDNEFTIKRLWKRGSSVKLQAANPT
jgi:DNA polymerase V